MREHLILRTTIPTQWMNQSLKIGLVLALLGIFPLVYAGAFASPAVLKTWGLLIFLGGFFLITAGLLPYRRLSRLQFKPNELHCVGLERLEYYQNGKPVLSLTLSSIDHFSFIDEPRFFGIAVSLKRPLPAKMTISCSTFDLRSFEKQAEKAQADAFFPYFSRRSFEELNAWILDDE
ncbi:Conserved putative membrane protein [Candidatus Protochlamydia naegleriophila]|uniref:Conserved putative membrane protein n=1 Tax=Candidatus Protochlamydia naegleriophila TaxID=389348 RepID=A0A0U5JIT7_9BACT|nr:hypothetical protein [Candidatus Protochlamydia naegleriophila]CUI17718.1 Conserved putative membrane protein [Candidatus Protochlamydia naegleriophila]